MKAGLRSTWQILKSSVTDFFEDGAFTLAAALAYYLALALAPILVLLLAIFGLFLTPDQQQQVIEQIQATMGDQAGQMIQTVLSNAQQPGTGSIAAWISIVMLILGATGIFIQLQLALNRIWDVQAKAGQGVVGYLRKRALSLAMFGVIALLLLVSLIVSAVLSGIARFADDLLPGGSMLWESLHMIVSLGVFVLLFAAIFKLLPDAEVQWRDVWVGAAITALLFAIGKAAIAYYLSMGSVGSAYGAAGSLIAMLVWVYYSALILFFGAELTQAYARVHGQRIVPDRHAQWAEHPKHPHEEGPQGQPSPA